jgi:UDP-N-acetylmuramate dehydrogenase
MPKQIAIPNPIMRARHNVFLAPLTTWHIGGPAEILVEPESINELIEVYKYAKEDGFPFTMLGRGSNVLIADEGIMGIVVCLRQKINHIKADSETGIITAEAGCPLPRVAITAEKYGIAGFEFLIGIPGTVGAGVAINAGIGGRREGTAINSVLVSTTVLNTQTGTVFVVKADELDLDYRYSNISKRKLIVLSATFKGQAAQSRVCIRQRQQEIMRKRSAKQPLQRHTSGSVFKQPRGGQPAGWYIDQAGLKGLQVGNATVSHQHANWIENNGGATAKDVRELIAFIQTSVFEKFGVTLEREVRYLPEESTLQL